MTHSHGEPRPHGKMPDQLCLARARLVHRHKRAGDNERTRRGVPFTEYFQRSLRRLHGLAIDLRTSVGEWERRVDLVWGLWRLQRRLGDFCDAAACRQHNVAHDKTPLCQCGVAWSPRSDAKAWVRCARVGVVAPWRQVRPGRPR